jgi:hypothetical protein
MRNSDINGSAESIALPLVWMYPFLFKFNSDSFLKAGNGFSPNKRNNIGLRLQYNSVGSVRRESVDDKHELIIYLF